MEKSIEDNGKGFGASEVWGFVDPPSLFNFAAWICSASDLGPVSSLTLAWGAGGGGGTGHPVGLGISGTGGGGAGGAGALPD